jgi:hypothetical protein
MDNNEQNPRTRSVKLPSGRIIEVVYLDNPDRFADPKQSAHRELHVCLKCGSRLVYPVEWWESSPTHWKVVLRCPNCETCDLDEFDQQTVDKFQEELDRGTKALTREYKSLGLANMEFVELPVFAAALNLDLITAADFAAPRNY